MNRIKNLKSVVFVNLVLLLIALQPAITFACDAGQNGHCGG